MNREIKTIAWNIIHKKGSGSTIMPNAIFHISIQFIVAVSLIMFSFTLWWLRWFYVGDECSNIIIVNAPDSFVTYTDESGIDTDVFIYKDFDASYDYVTYGQWMRDTDSYLTVVFPSDFEKIIANPEADIPDVLTFYRTNSVEYTQGKDEFIENLLDPYENYLKTRQGIPVSNSEVMSIYEQGMSTTDEDIHTWEYFVKSMALTVFPLVMFILVLYISMSAGTNVIAGEKERGTFAAILMTPVKRINIVLGNIIGVAIKALIPSIICTLLFVLIPFYRSLAGIVGIISAIILLISLAILIASITILISVLNDSVVQAQTAFLPIFLVMIAVCVTCIQDVRDVAAFYYMLPVYGHFYGIGFSVIGESNILYTLICLITSGLMSYICISVSEKLLHHERFTVSGNQITDKDIRKEIMLTKKQSQDYISKPKITIFGYKNIKRTSTLGFFFDQIVYPLAVLSLFQLLALIPTVIVYMRKPEYSQFIYSLKAVKTVPDIIVKSFEVMAIFLGDPLFLVLMSLGYIGIIATYIIRIRISEKNSPATMGLIRGNVVTSYVKGLLLGLGLMGSVYVLLIIIGQIIPSVPRLSLTTVITIFAGLLMWIPQGAAEEVMFRGFMLPRQGSRYGAKFALIFSSILFAAFHSMNMGFTPLAFINLFLIAFFFALLDLKAGHIWYTCAAHTMWNFLQGNIFGLQVSGNQGASTLLNARYTSHAKDIINGGDFGPEGGLVVTFVTVVAIAILIINSRKTSRGHLEPQQN